MYEDIVHFLNEIQVTMIGKGIMGNVCVIMVTTDIFAEIRWMTEGGDRYDGWIFEFMSKSEHATAQCHVIYN